MQELDKLIGERDKLFKKIKLTEGISYIDFVLNEEDKYHGIAITDVKHVLPNFAPKSLCTDILKLIKVHYTSELRKLKRKKK